MTRPSAPLIAAALPATATVALHQLIPSLPVPERVTLVGIGPMEHVGRAVFLGIEGPLGVGAMLLMLTVVAITLYEAVGALQRIDLLALGLFAGGSLSNGLEAFLRGSVIDWLWLTPDGRHTIVVNSADAAIFAGIIMMVGRIVLRMRAIAEDDLRP